MSVIKSVSVGRGDMYYIRHNSDNFTMIDCMLPANDAERRTEIVDELIDQGSDKVIRRFISTHPDQDHVQGLKYLDDRMEILNFYCIRNATTKEDPTEDFNHYCNLRDSQKAFYIFSGCERRWMNQSGDGRRSAGINILWPDTSNPDFRDALAASERAESPNNTSAIIKYSLENGVTALWMGDLESDFMTKVEDEVELPDTDIFFASHHGRKSGRAPDSWLEQMNPKVIVIGEADPEDLDNYTGWNTIRQLSAGDIAFDCRTERVDVYVGSAFYTVDFLYDAGVNADLGNYIGSFDV